VSIGTSSSVASASTNGISIGVSAACSVGTGPVCIGANCVANVQDGVALGRAATTNSIATSVAIGATASPLNTAHSLAFAINAASITAGADMGVTLNGVAYQIPIYSSLYSTTATAAATTTLTVTSSIQQYFTGTSAQTVQLPDLTTLALGTRYRLINKSTGKLTVTTSSAATVIVIPPSTSCVMTSLLTSGSLAASWDYDMSPLSGQMGTYYVFLASSGQAVTASTAINWNTVNSNAQSISSAGVITVPVTGMYTVSFVTATTSGTYNAYVYKNGSILSGTANNAAFYSSFSMTFLFTAGDTVDIRLSSSLTLASNANINQVTFTSLF
jgi:hypothetical protein